MCEVSESSSDHWQHIYGSRPCDEMSWFQVEPTMSVRLLEDVVGASGSVVDVGAGASSLADILVADGYADITVVDVSETALNVVRERLRDSLDKVSVVCADVLDWEPGRAFDAWHDRAVFHFLTSPKARSRYVTMVEESVAPTGSLVMATFALDGPTHCSGLPVCRYDAHSLAAEFSAAFDLVRSEREVHSTPAGVEQPFTWVVLRRR
jgi:2-polyprenyl-3-methyl-5-hydroxy-6-metoxy-1,4-benzoquinol methylase